MEVRENAGGSAHPVRPGDRVVEAEHQEERPAVDEARRQHVAHPVGPLHLRAASVRLGLAETSPTQRTAVRNLVLHGNTMHIAAEKDVRG